MRNLLSSKKAPDPTVGRPTLELSGPALRQALSDLIKACEPAGGIEKYAEALRLRSEVFQDVFANGANSELDPDQFVTLSGLMPTVRRRIGPFVEDDETFSILANAVLNMFKAESADEAILNLRQMFPQDKRHRWVKDMGAEILHNCEPEKTPLMCRWVWDAKSNTGVLREIWHGEIDHIQLDIADGYETFLMLREELSQFLTQNGMYKDILWYVDLLCAQVYAEYISSQGGTYLRADFSTDEDPAAHLRRLLGLDGVRAKTSRPRPSVLDEEAETNGPLFLTGKVN